MNHLIPALIAGLLMASPVSAQEAAGKAGDISISAPWSRATAPRAPNGAVFLTLSNAGGQVDRLVSAQSPVADKVELHTHIQDGDVMRMRQVDGIEVAPGAPTALQPGGLHIMLMGLKHPLTEGQSFPVTLAFKQAGNVTVPVTVQSAGASAPAHGGMMGHGAAMGHGGKAAGQ
jgi:periplasmic copper chaperone A